MKNAFYYNTKIGKIKIEDNGRAITKVVYLKDEEEDVNIIKEETTLIKEAVKEIHEYLDGKRKNFEVPLELEGTEFQRKVWNALSEIPYGETRSYGEIAKVIGNEKAARAVGMANNKNPIMIIIPCHRVIGSKGKLVGYACGLEIKEHLLELEKGSKA